MFEEKAQKLAQIHWCSLWHHTYHPLGSCRIMKSGKIIISQLSGERLRIRQIHIEVKLSWRIECKNALDTRRDLVRCSLQHFQPVLRDSSIKSCILQARMMQDLLTVELIEGVQIWNTCPKTYGSRILYIALVDLPRSTNLNPWSQKCHLGACPGINGLNADCIQLYNIWYVSLYV